MVRNFGSDLAEVDHRAERAREGVRDHVPLEVQGPELREHLAAGLLMWEHLRPEGDGGSFFRQPTYLPFCPSFFAK